jgi:hypothetical protein
MKILISHALRRTICLMCFSLALGACDLVNSADKLKSEATNAITARNFSSAAHFAQKWSEKTPDQYEAYFVLAQAQAQAGDRNAALVALEHAIKNGLKDDVQIESNTNLDPIKSMIAYGALMNTNFPGRQTKLDAAQEGPMKGIGDAVSITEKDGQQTLRAGDVVIQMPVVK